MDKTSNKKTQIAHSLMEDLTENVRYLVTDAVARNKEQYVLSRSDKRYVPIVYEDRPLNSDPADADRAEIQKILDWEFRVPLLCKQYKCYDFIAKVEDLPEETGLLKDQMKWALDTARNYIDENRALISYTIESLENVEKIKTEEELEAWLSSDQKHCLVLTNGSYEHFVRIPISVSYDEIYFWDRKKDCWSMYGVYDHSQLCLV